MGQAVIHSHIMNPHGSRETQSLLFTHYFLCQVMGKDKEIKYMVTNFEQRKDLNIQGKKKGERGCKQRGRQADSECTSLKKY